MTLKAHPADINSLLKQHVDILCTIFESFGIDDGYGEIDNRTADFFCLNDDCVKWSLETFDPMEDGEYMADIQNKYENETHYLLYVDNGCGENFYQVFDKSKEIL